MKLVLSGCGVFIALTVVATATPVSCVTTSGSLATAITPNSAAAIATYNGTGGSGSMKCGPLTLSNFVIVDASGGNAISASLSEFPSTWDPATGQVFVVLDPNLMETATFQDVHLFFNVTSSSAITAITDNSDLSTRAATVSNSERVCSGAIDIATGSCSGAIHFDATASASSGGLTSLNIFKDIGHLSGGHVAAFAETFTFSKEDPTTTVPEPVSLLLLGLGTLALAGLARLRRN